MKHEDYLKYAEHVRKLECPAYRAECSYQTMCFISDKLENFYEFIKRKIKKCK